MKVRGKAALEGAVIHSDGGGQYYSHVFRALTKRLKMSNSMTEESVYENSHAERLNGTIKNSYLYPYGPETFGGLKKELKRAVYMYNNGKPHKALDKMSPVQYRQAHSVGTGNNPPQVPGCFPVPTENQNQHNTDFDIEKKKKLRIVSLSFSISDI